MSYELVLPAMGESVSEATIVKWLKQPGDYVEAEELVVEIATDKVDSEVPSPVAGRLIAHKVAVNDVVQIGQVIALLAEENVTDQNQVIAKEKKEEYPAEIEEKTSIFPGLDQLRLMQGDNIHADKIIDSTRFYSPLVRNIAQAEGLSVSQLDQIEGTGLKGRVTKEDVLAYITGKKQPKTSIELNPESGKKDESETSKQTPLSMSAGNDEIIEMDRMRRIIADRMSHSVQTAPHVTSFVEAVAKVLKEFPMVNVSVNGTQIIKRKAINIGMATALPNGNLIVPVIKAADTLNLTGLTKSVNDLANRARNNKLKPDDTQGGTFTITNIGSFGNIMGTPIINQPQVAILAIGTIVKKPAVIETEEGDLIGIRHKLYLSMSYDHRVVDGALGGTFLKRVADYLEYWDVHRKE